MKNKVLSFLYSILPYCLLGQFGPQQFIATEIDQPHFVSAADADGDQDFDVLVAALGKDEFLLYKNLDGNGQFGEAIVVGKGWIPTSIYPADFDGDGDQDFLTVSSFDGAVRVYFNADGLGTLTDSLCLCFGGPTASFKAIPVDVDGDGDLDIVADNRQWFENLDGLGSFDVGKVYAEEKVGFYKYKTFDCADMDGDNDQDIVVTRYASAVFAPDSVSVSWIENLDGQGLNWSEHLIAYNYSPQADFSFATIHITDLDNDGDIDILIGDSVLDEISLFKNENNTGEFSDQIIITENANYPSSIKTHDIDNDGDLDIFAGMLNEPVIAWYENDGNSNFSAEKYIELAVPGTRSIFLADLNGDGDLDILSASHSGSFGDQVVWNENIFNKSLISGNVFLDENQDGIFNYNEIGINEKVLIQPNASLYIPTVNGGYRFFVGSGDYTLMAQPSPLWESSTSSTTNVSAPEMKDTIIQNLGLKPIGEVSQGIINLSSAPTRCGFKVPFWLDYKNTGNQTANGNITLVLDDLATLVESMPTPDNVSGTQLYWNFQNLPPTHNGQISLLIEMPGVDALGDTIFLNGTVNLFNNIGAIVYTSDHLFTSEINCSYDPNDKSVDPDPIGEENITAIGTALEYTIRFQNTGTDTAFTVMIEDQLDENLNWATITPISSSHPYSLTLSEIGKLTFLFEDILLPDSTTNERASHGFMKFKIEHKENLVKNTIIENTANIFFDFNPPITTNTISNTFANPVLTYKNVIEAQTSINIFPNPTFGQVQVEINNPYSQEYQLSIYNSAGAMIQYFNNTGKNLISERLLIDKLAPGVYYIVFKNFNIIEAQKLIVF